jgi:hypothetical protein
MYIRFFKGLAIFIISLIIYKKYFIPINIAENKGFYNSVCKSP